VNWKSGVVVAVLLVGCGGGSSTSSSSGSGAATNGAAASGKAATCAHIQPEALAVGADAGALARPNPPTSATDKAISDADTLKTSITELKGEISDEGQKAQLDQGLQTMDQFVQAVRAEVSGDIQAANGQLAGVASEYGTLLSSLKTICGT
jgi:hypothetical protein